MTYQADSIALAKKGLTATEHNILRYFQGISDYDNNVPKVTNSFLAKELDVTELTISTCLKGLTEKGILIKKEELGTWHYVISKSVSTRGREK